jgi:SAM-dependent methyltransferase
MKRLPSRAAWFVVPAAAALVGAALDPSALARPSAEPTGVALIRRQAEALAPLVQSPLAKNFLQATADLPAVPARTLYRDAAKTTYYSQAQADRLSADERKQLKPVPVDESLYYNTKYGSPLAYVRPLEVLGQAGMIDVAGKRILDFGYGTIGHLRLLATLGSDAVGVDVDPLLPALYSEPSDQGTIAGQKSEGRAGKVTLVHGRYPAEPGVAKAVGEGYDLILSKNTLKNGYLHPAQPVDKRMLIDLGVTEAAFVQTLYHALKPGGKVLIYNICPAPNPPGKPYIPWADGRCPFSKEMWEAAGFRVVALDQDDSGPVRQVAHALGWDRGGQAMSLEKDLFAHYTLVEKPADR